MFHVLGQLQSMNLRYYLDQRTLNIWIGGEHEQIQSPQIDLAPARRDLDLVIRKSNFLNSSLDFGW